MAAQAPIRQKKRLLVCCDGTWMNSDKGYDNDGKAQVPSNVTRISRAFKRQCSDGTVQIIEYQSGVGTGSTLAETFTGGAFGAGISEHIREIYSFICANYVDGDEIVLIGFSRGAYTARSVAGMIGDLGLLTREGMDHFYPIFKDMENWRTPNYRDPFPTNPFPKKPTGEDVEARYRQMLVEHKFTRVNQGNGDLIKVKAVGVWDTVGSLGIPSVAWLEKLGFQRSTKEFYDTALSDRIEHAFQALGLDEHRPPFSPAIWERPASNKRATDLRQVWFPGNHANVGGGWADQGIANMSLAWMMDQLASVGVEFDQGSIDRLFEKSESYYRWIGSVETNNEYSLTPDQAPPPDATFTRDNDNWFIKLFKGKPLPWAVDLIYKNNHPIRPWALGAIHKATGFVYVLAGQITRSPGNYKKVDPFTGRTLQQFLEDTNERIHTSVRVRLATKGLGLDDKAIWDCPALHINGWTLQKTDKDYYDPIPGNLDSWQPNTQHPAPGQNGTDNGPPTPPALQRDTDSASWGGRWVWKWSPPRGYQGASPPHDTLVEEPLGPYERHLLKLAAGSPNVFEFAEEIAHSH